MSFTRFHDDEIRIKKQLEQQTFPGRYQLDVPGQGSSMPFQEDAHLNLQKFGANIRTNTINLESDLLGLTRNLSLDCNTYKKYAVNAITKNIASSVLIVPSNAIV